MARKIDLEQSVVIQKMWLSHMYSMSDIAETIGVTRTGIWNHLRKLGLDTSKNMSHVERTCAKCGKQFVELRNRIKYRNVKYCSNECRTAAIRNPDYIENRQKQREARKIVSQYFDLKPGQVVHHIDRNNLNNDITNLMVLKNGSDHLKWHRAGGDKSGVRPLFDGRRKVKEQASMNIYRVSDVDWFAAKNAREARRAAKDFYESICGDIDGLYEKPARVSESEMDKLTFIEDHYGEAEDRKPFRQKLAEMIAGGERFPCMFATTEF